MKGKNAKTCSSGSKQVAAAAEAQKQQLWTHKCENNNNRTEAQTYKLYKGKYNIITQPTTITTKLINFFLSIYIYAYSFLQ